MKFEVVAVGELKPDFLSKLIQLFQSWCFGKIRDVNFSHLAVLVDGCRVFDATGRGISECTLPELLDGGKAVIRKRFEITVKRECCALEWLEARQGIPYSNWQYLGFLFPFLRWVPGVSNGGKKSVCSEFAADFLFKCSVLEPRYFAEREWMLPVHVTDLLEFLNVKQISE